MPRGKHLLLVAGAAVVIFALAPFWCTGRNALMVEAVSARRAPLRVIVATNGKVEPANDVEVRARLDGRVVAVVDPGRQVQTGEEVVRLDDGPVTTQLAMAEAERLDALESLRVARAVSAERRERLATDQRLYKAGGLTREAYETTQRQAQEAAAQVDHLAREVPLRVAGLERRIAELRAQREATVVRAPFAGTVYKTQVKKGELVRLGDALLWIADLEHLRVRTNVDQVDLGRVQPGQNVRVSANAFPDRIWTGSISEIVPNVVVKESRAVSESLAKLDAPVDGLVPGMTVDVEIVVAEDADALQVPAEAVLTEGSQAYVFRVVGRRVRKTPVRTGLSSVTAVAIQDGLTPDAVVVVGPTAGLSDGMRVTPRRRDA